MTNDQIALHRRNLDTAFENREVVRNIPGHKKGEFIGVGNRSSPCKFDQVTEVHEILLMAIVEASTRRNRNLFFMIDKRKIKIELPVVQWVSEKWIERLQKYLYEHRDEVFLPAENDFDSKVIKINTPWALELTISNIK